MMFDAVRLTRSIPDKTEKNLSDIDKVISHQLNSGQFDTAMITLKEINTIREAFKRFLSEAFTVSEYLTPMRE